MKSKKNGKSTSRIEIQNISKHGFWLFIKDKEYFLPFQIYPWFKEAKISDIQNVCLHNEHHLNWPSLDVDLEIESIQSPDKYPMSYK